MIRVDCLLVSKASATVLLYELSRERLSLICFKECILCPGQANSRWGWDNLTQGMAIRDWYQWYHRCCSCMSQSMVHDCFPCLAVCNLMVIGQVAAHYWLSPLAIDLTGHRQECWASRALLTARDRGGQMLDLAASWPLGMFFTSDEFLRIYSRGCLEHITLQQVHCLGYFVNLINSCVITPEVFWNT